MIFYRLVATVLAPFLAAGLLLRLLLGRETLGDAAQRLGAGTGKTGAIWVHGASNGELTSARALIQALRHQNPHRPLVITSNTVTGRDLVAGWTLADVSARLAPLDYRWALARFRARWQPAVLIVLENELWPNRIVTTQVPLICIGARMSARSAARWRRLGGLARCVIGRIDVLSAQDAASAQRFVELGLDPTRLVQVLSLKQTVELPKPPAQELAALQRIFSRADTVLAASTHSGEESAILRAFVGALAERPELKLILAPRHPRRSAEIAGMIAKTGLPFATRSAAEIPDAGTAIYLADTLGEMPLWYALAGVSFVGGSLVDKGGHTPFEPVQAGTAILHGPHVSNFSQVYAQLDAAGGARMVANAEELQAAMVALESPQSLADMAHSAVQTLEPVAKNELAVILEHLQQQLKDCR